MFRYKEVLLQDRWDRILWIFWKNMTVVVSITYIVHYSQHILHLAENSLIKQDLIGEKQIYFSRFSLPERLDSFSVGSHSSFQLAKLMETFTMCRTAWLWKVFYHQEPCHSVLQLSLAAGVWRAVRRSSLRLHPYWYVKVRKHSWALDLSLLLCQIVGVICGMGLAQIKQCSLKSLLDTVQELAWARSCSQ